MSELQRGDKSFFEDDAFWLIGCAFHRGQAQVGSERRIDPDTKKDRVELVDVIDAATGAPVTDAAGGFVRELQPIDLPIWSEDVGYEPACVACRRSVMEMRQHIDVVRQSREQAEFEHVEFLRQSGLSVPANVTFDDLKAMVSELVTRREA